MSICVNTSASRSIETKESKKQAKEEREMKVRNGKMKKQGGRSAVAY
jgi:hypothetical protein